MIGAKRSKHIKASSIYWLGVMVRWMFVFVCVYTCYLKRLYLAFEKIEQVKLSCFFSSAIKNMKANRYVCRGWKKIKLNRRIHRQIYLWLVLQKCCIEKIYCKNVIKCLYYAQMHPFHPVSFFAVYGILHRHSTVWHMFNFFRFSAFI